VATRAAIENTQVLLPHHTALRYVLPLREGGSLPAIVDTDEGGQYVVKFRGAGQGPKALVAEVIAAGLARVLELPAPEAAIIELAEGFGEAEPNPEIQDLLRASTGKNFGLKYLSGALCFDPLADRALVTSEIASAIVWFDAYLTNVDRTARNSNLLVWQRQLWLIDHGACLYFHHAGGDWQGRSQDPFPLIEDHILLGLAKGLREADARLAPKLTENSIRAVVAAVPDEWLGGDGEGQRQAYVGYLLARAGGVKPWIEEAVRAQRRSAA
jgi:hypothetical protein